MECVIDSSTETSGASAYAQTVGTRLSLTVHTALIRDATHTVHHLQG